MVLGYVMKIKRYSEADEMQLFEMLRDEGTEWECYFAQAAGEKYKQVLKQSVTFVVYAGDVLCGYVRGRNDDGFGIYVYDLLVKKAYRGLNIGKKLVDRICEEYPEDTIYVMSDADGYYEKQGYYRVGSIYKVHV